MLKSSLIAITGPPGSGKTTALNMLSQLGATVISADDIVHQLLISDKACIEELKKNLRVDITTNRQIDRKKVAAVVFADPEKLRTLEQIIHPRVKQEIEKARAAHSEYLIVEVPLLYEIGWENDFDAVLYITAPTSICKRRFSEKGFSENEFEKRTKRLLPEAEKIKKASFVINNQKSKEDLQKEIKKIYQQLRNS